MNRPSCSRVWAACLMSVMTASAWAHHSTAAYDYSKSMTLEGTVKAFQFTNPHIFFQLMVPDAQGRLVEWNIECGTLNINARQGWRKTDLNPGDKVKALIHPMREGPGGTLMSVTFADGRTLYGAGNRGGGPPGGGPPAGGPPPE